MASEQGSKLPKVDKATSFPWDADAASISAFEERSKTIFVNPTRKQPGWIDVFGLQNLVHGSSSAVSEARIHQEQEFERWADFDQVVYVLRFTLNSFSRISPSLGLFTHMMERIRVCPRFKEFVMSFGAKTNEYDYSTPACKIRTSSTSSPLSYPSGVAENLQRLECLYGFRYAASTNDDDPWSMRQIAVYQNYDFSARKVVWTVVGASQPAEKLLRTRMETSSDKPSIVDVFSLHASLLDMSLADWRRFLWDLTEKVQKVHDHVVFAEAEGSDLNLPKGVKTDFRDRQRLNVVRDKISGIIVSLHSTSATIRALQLYFSQWVKANGHFSKHADDVMRVFDESLEEASTYLNRAKNLDAKATDTATLLSDLLSYENTISLKNDSDAMRKMSQQATEDSRSIKVITIITTVFVPPTVTASFFSMQFVQVGNGDLQVARCVWVYFVVTIVLMLLTVGAWVAMLITKKISASKEEKCSLKANAAAREKSVSQERDKTDSDFESCGV